MKSIKQTQSGFTVIELMVAILVISAIAVLALSNVRTMRAESRDNAKKTDINAIYFQLESFYEKNNSYPEKIDQKILSGIDPDSLKDENGTNINEAGSQYRYKPKNCDDKNCKSYNLEADLEREAVYKKEALHQ